MNYQCIEPKIKPLIVDGYESEPELELKELDEADGQQSDPELNRRREKRDASQRRKDASPKR